MTAVMLMTATAGASDATAPLLRPGNGINVPDGGGLCTLGLLWRGSDGARYMSTAGHCARKVEGEFVFPRGRGIEVQRAEGPSPLVLAQQRVGEFAYYSLKPASGAEGVQDFALIRLDKQVLVSPQVCHFGGPTGVNDDRPHAGPPIELRFYGQANAISAITPARTLYALGMPDPKRVAANGPATIGDSGSAVMSRDGRAVGTIVNGGLQGVPDSPGTTGIQRFGPDIERAMRALRVRLSLVTAPLLDPAVPAGAVAGCEA